jgi:anti-sigma regulatory factor (Ser/Thr protein kinase)
MYQGQQQVASTQVRDRRYSGGQQEAPTSMLSATTDRQVRITLPPVPESAGLAREFTAAALRKWHLDPLISDAVLIASELVTNAIDHGTAHSDDEGPGLVELTWSYQISRLICVITDRATEPPVIAPTDTDAESGHGLQIVAALAAAWGWTMLGTGQKAVWAALHLPAH